MEMNYSPFSDFYIQIFERSKNIFLKIISNKVIDKSSLGHFRLSAVLFLNSLSYSDGAIIN